MSDTRREDVEVLAATICDGNAEHLRAWPLVAESAYCGQCHSAAERVLAVLPAPPVTVAAAVADVRDDCGTPGDEEDTYAHGWQHALDAVEKAARYLTPAPPVVGEEAAVRALHAYGWGGRSLCLMSHEYREIVRLVLDAARAPVVDEAQIQNVILEAIHHAERAVDRVDVIASEAAAVIAARLRGADRG